MLSYCAKGSTNNTMTETTATIRLTEYSHGAGCGCKISPEVLSTILKSDQAPFVDPRLLIGNRTRDDAAVYALDDDRVIISTTDFFMPIVDNPRDFGGIAAVNAISDIYAMGGTPIMAIAILGWPVDQIAPEVAQQVLEGARDACARAGIALGGGHSIDAPEPIFGLAVTGTALKQHIKSNDGANEGCELYLTKPLGVGILSTAQKKGLLEPEDLETIRDLMLTLNDVGEVFGKMTEVRALTDVTGFGLLGHLIELAEGSGLSAVIDFDRVPKIAALPRYMEHKTFPGGTERNFRAYGHKVAPMSDDQQMLLCDPQTSGGLLAAVEPTGREAFLAKAAEWGLELEAFGRLEAEGKHRVFVR